MISLPKAMVAEEAAARVEEELAKLPGDEPEVFATGSFDDRPYIAMELLDGALPRTELDVVAERCRAMPWTTAPRSAIEEIRIALDARRDELMVDAAIRVARERDQLAESVKRLCAELDAAHAALAMAADAPVNAAGKPAIQVGQRVFIKGAGGGTRDFVSECSVVSGSKDDGWTLKIESPFCRGHVLSGVPTEEIFAARPGMTALSVQRVVAERNAAQATLRRMVKRVVAERDDAVADRNEVASPTPERLLSDLKKLNGKPTFSKLVAAMRAALSVQRVVAERNAAQATLRRMVERVVAERDDAVADRNEVASPTPERLLSDLKKLNGEPTFSELVAAMRAVAFMLGVEL
jgi:hypothetical protein